MSISYSLQRTEDCETEKETQLSSLACTAQYISERTK